MKNNIHWEKSVFSDSCKIFAEKELIGKLESNLFSSRTLVVINGNYFTFRIADLFKQNTEIIENSSNKVIGSITYDNMMSTALIRLNGQNYSWKYHDLLCTRWTVTNAKSERIEYSSNFLNGEIKDNIENDLLLLTGLYIKNYYLQLTVVILLVVLIPILL